MEHNKGSSNNAFKYKLTKLFLNVNQLTRDFRDFWGFQKDFRDFRDFRDSRGF
jgi:hypothetical protein